MQYRVSIAMPTVFVELKQLSAKGRPKERVQELDSAPPRGAVHVHIMYLVNGLTLFVVNLGALVSRLFWISYSTCRK